MRDVRISADLRRENRSVDSLKPKNTLRGNKEAFDNGRLKNSSIRNNYILNKYNASLFRGSSGIALKYLLKFDLTDEEKKSEEVNIAKEIMSTDGPSKDTVFHINSILNKIKEYKEKDDDLKKLMYYKSQFRLLFHEAKKEYDELTN